MRDILIWYLGLAAGGLAALPAVSYLFRYFEDRGWLFARTLGLFFGAWCMWTLNVPGWSFFTRRNIERVLFVMFILNYGVYAAATIRRRCAYAKAGLKSIETAKNAEPEKAGETEENAGLEKAERTEKSTELEKSGRIEENAKLKEAGRVEESAEREKARQIEEAADEDCPEAEKHNKKKKPAKTKQRSARVNLRIVLAEELIFFVTYGLWVYIIGFRPEAYGTEKFMDYGFMTSMMRSVVMPFEDTWFSGNAVNYYYGGQYIATYLVKMTGVPVGEGYNLMRATAAAFSFVLPMSLVRQMMTDRLRGERRSAVQIRKTVPERTAEVGKSGGTVSGENEEKTKEKNKGEATEKAGGAASWCAGLLAGCAVAYCGNGHYLLYGIIKPVIAALTGKEYSYWFPDSTRYIGYNPDLPDKTIHEFPAYSTVLGDLHAHYLNILFVVTVVAVVYAWAERYAAVKGKKANRNISASEAEAKKADPEIEASEAEAKKAEREIAVSEAGTGEDSAEHAVREAPEKRENWRGSVPYVLLTGFLTGAFRWTNFWDFPIYYVVCGSIFFFVQLQGLPPKGKRAPFILNFIFKMILIAAGMFAAGYLAALPFTVSFDQISSEIGLTHSHTLWYQMLILWGLPSACLVGYAVTLFREKHAAGRPGCPDAANASESKTDEADAFESRTDKTADTFEKKTAVEENESVSAERETDVPAQKKHHIHVTDLCVLMLGLCAAGLVFLPEVIYVKDIYAAEHYRANTMFKLTYQAYILFGMMMGYVLVRGIVFGRSVTKKAGDCVRQEGASTADESKGIIIQARSEGASQKVGSGNDTKPEIKQISAAGQETVKESVIVLETERAGEAGKKSVRAAYVLSVAGTVVLLLMGGYIFKSCRSWFGDVTDPSKRISTDASVFVSKYYPSDYEAVNYLNTHVYGQPVVLEAPGASYSDYERVSVATGLPTVAGWHTHEWLWRGDPAELDQRCADVETIYTSRDEAEVRSLLEKYDVAYIFAGNLEHEKYQNLNDEMLWSLGETVYSDGYETYIVRVK